MQPIDSIKKVRKYAVAAFIVPLIAINSCLLLYKFVGDLNINKYANFNYNEQRQSQTYKIKEFNKINNDTKSYSFTNCSKYEYYRLWTSLDGESTADAQVGISNEDFIINKEKISDLQNKNQVKTVTRIYTKKLNNRCIKNHQFLNSLFLKLSFMEKVVLVAIKENTSGFSKINNPYLFGEVSISRTARYFPATLIFKPLIILSAIFLLLYWKNNLNLLNELKNKSILNQFSKKFFYIGVLSCVFLILHALFLGLDYKAEWFEKIRKVVIILFIVFEVSAQFFLTKNLYKFKKELRNYINIAVLKIKVIFVISVLALTCVAFFILGFTEPSSNFKHSLEWNYFAFLLFFYLLSRFLWRVNLKNSVHAPKGA